MPVSVSVREELIGWHSWPAADDTRRYLRSLHRHRFHVVLELPVTHNDRDFEFHDMGDWLRLWWGDERSQRDRGSCETLASEIAACARAIFGTAPVSVSVGEDGEAWATWRPRPDPEAAHVPNQ